MIIYHPNQQPITIKTKQKTLQLLIIVALLLFTSPTHSAGLNGNTYLEVSAGYVETDIDIVDDYYGILLQYNYALTSVNLDLFCSYEYDVATFKYESLSDGYESMFVVGARYYKYFTPKTNWWVEPMVIHSKYRFLDESQSDQSYQLALGLEFLPEDSLALMPYVAGSNNFSDHDDFEYNYGIIIDYDLFSQVGLITRLSSGEEIDWSLFVGLKYNFTHTSSR